MEMTIKGRLNPQGRLDLTITTAGVTQQRTIDWPPDALLAEGLRLLQLKHGLKPGTTFTARTFDPVSLAALEVQTRVGRRQEVDLLGRVVELTQVNAEMCAPGATITAVTFVDDQCNALKTIAPIVGMTCEIISCDRAFALSPNSAADFFDKMLLDCPTPWDQLASAPAVTYQLTPTVDHHLQVPAGPSQHVTADDQGRLTVTVKPIQPPGAATFPYAGADPLARASLEPTDFLQIDHPQIQQLARQAVADTKDAAQAVQKIESFVHDYIDEQTLSIGYATALEVADSRAGDCTEHALLTAALCRAVGIPAQVVMGLVHIDRFGNRANVFGGHAWTRAYVGQTWIDLDATRAPNGFTPGHIALSYGNGDPETFYDLANSLGQFQITAAQPAQN